MSVVVPVPMPLHAWRHGLILTHIVIIPWSISATHSSGRLPGKCGCRSKGRGNRAALEVILADDRDDDDG